MQTSINKIIYQDMLLIIGLRLSVTGNVLKEVNIQSVKTLCIRNFISPSNCSQEKKRKGKIYTIQPE